jgi:hypothetical protein
MCYTGKCENETYRDYNKTDCICVKPKEKLCYLDFYGEQENNIKLYLKKELK